MFEVSFYKIQGLIISLTKLEYFLPFGFCLPEFGPVVCVSLIHGEISPGFLLFVFPPMGKAE